MRNKYKILVGEPENKKRAIGTTMHILRWDNGPNTDSVRN
jgi:hypothetical protein